MEASYLVERAASSEETEPRFVVVDGSYRLHVEASAYLAALRGLDRSPNTERVYAGRLALFLSYCAAARISWQEIAFAELARFLRWLVTEPLPPRGPESPVRYRRAATANAVLTTVCEFLRFGAAHGWVSTELVARLSHPKQLRYLPGHDGGEAGQFATVQAKSLKLREVPAEVESLTAEQVDAVIAATWRVRDRFLVSLLAATGMRIGEVLGLRREDLHLLANGAPVGCSTDGPHVHIRRRRNENGAIAKSRYPRTVPVLDGLVGLYADYQHERFATAGAGESDLVFVNLYRPPIGAGLQYGAAIELFERLSGIVGFRVRPHMLRHSAASRWIESGVPRDVVQHLLGHVSAASMEPYLHPTDAAKRAAVERGAAGAGA
jgi:integrase/recombinase XerD